jgi:catechol 2,3-dioxygenase-like lactoylglutathione lyase family enzyme
VTSRTVLVLVLLAAGSFAGTGRERPTLEAAAAVGPIALTVRDAAATAAFFRDRLDFTMVSDIEIAGRDVELLYGVFGARVRVIRMQLGGEQIELTEFLAPRGRDYPADTRANDRWFQHIAIITSDMTAAYERLRARGVAHASTAPQRLPEWNKNAAGIEAFYFRGPDGHFLEVLAFPPGKGDTRWHDKRRLFLGIDHTAVVSGDTERSLRFYRDGLGLSVAGRSDNYGIEQEHLNNVFGARLRITTLRAAAGPGIELLEYLTPRDGRPTPIDLKANDLAHWHSTIVTRRAAAIIEAPFGGWLVSPTVVPIDRRLGYAQGLLVRDPDGHGIRLVERPAS